MSFFGNLVDLLVGTVVIRAAVTAADYNDRVGVSVVP